MAYRIKWTSKPTGSVSYSRPNEDRKLTEAWLSHPMAEFPEIVGEIEEVSPDCSEPDTGPRQGWVANPQCSRDLVRILLNLLGVELPMPLMREES